MHPIEIAIHFSSPVPAQPATNESGKHHLALVVITLNIKQITTKKLPPPVLQSKTVVMAGKCSCALHLDISSKFY